MKKKEQANTHKSAEEPYRHVEDETSAHMQQSKADGKQDKTPEHDTTSKNFPASSKDDADLKSREYIDKDGSVHHHTKKYESDHKG